MKLGKCICSEHFSRRQCDQLTYQCIMFVVMCYQKYSWPIGSHIKYQKCVKM